MKSNGDPTKAMTVQGIAAGHGVMSATKGAAHL